MMRYVPPGSKVTPGPVIRLTRLISIDVSAPVCAEKVFCLWPIVVGCEKSVGGLFFELA